jgi:LCP family protein required for cell wall assembly
MSSEVVSKGSVSARKKRVLVIIAAVVAVLLSACIVGYLVLANKLHTILPGGPISAITKNEPLKTVDGRTNFLLFGTSYDDPNPSHTAGYLTDSLIVLSVDKQAKTAYTFSIPRDLWVTYDTPCSSGESGKVNAVYSCALKAYNSDNTKATKALTDKVSQISGLPIQYYVETNYTLIKSLTDAVGGIDVDIYTHDPRGIYDPQVGLKLPASVNHLDGKTALKLARARNSHGGYGLPRSNFDREINQQRIIDAIFKKASANGTFDNIGSGLKLIDALSGNLHTDVQTGQLRDALNTAKSLQKHDVTSVPLTDYLTTGTIRGQSVVQPAAGLDNYTAVQTYISEKLLKGTK